MRQYGVKCVRSPNSVMGYGEAWLKRDGVSFQVETMEEAQAEAKRLTEAARSPNVGYFAEEM